MGAQGASDTHTHTHTHTLCTRSIRKHAGRLRRSLWTPSISTQLAQKGLAAHIRPASRPPPPPPPPRNGMHPARGSLFTSCRQQQSHSLVHPNRSTETPPFASGRWGLDSDITVPRQRSLPSLYSIQDMLVVQKKQANPVKGFYTTWGWMPLGVTAMQHMLSTAPSTCLTMVDAAVFFFFICLFLFADKYTSHPRHEISFSHAPRLLGVNHGADAVALLHDLERRVDLSQGLAVRDELIDLELAVEVVLHEPWELAASLDATKGTSLPHTAGDELECYMDISFGSGNTDKDNLRLVAISWPAAATPMMML